MKALVKNFARLTLALVVVGSAGCQTHKSTAPLANGYEVVTHPHHTLFEEPEPPRLSLQHRGANGKTTQIWPALYGISGVIKNDLVIFVGDKSYREPEKVTHPRLFAVQSPELPLDITDEVLWLWAKTSGQDFAKTLERYSLVAPVEKNGGLELQLDFYSNEKDWPDKGVLQLSWDQVTQIMRAVKKKGVVEKDLRWRTRYIGEKF